MTALQRGIQIFKQVRSCRPPEPVNVMEFGVYKGDTLRTIVRECGDMPNVSIFGFDSFEGLPHDWEHTVCKKGTFSTGGVIPDIPEAEFYVGWFEDTLPEFTKVNTDPIGLLHLDADLYSSTKTILEGLNHLITYGTVIVCDEWTYNGYERRDDQEQRAFLEWQKGYDRFIAPIEYTDPTFDGWHVGAERALFLVLG